MKLKDSDRDLVFQFVVTTRCNLRCNNCSYGCTSKKANLVYNPDILKKDILYVEQLLANNSNKTNQGACLQGGETLLYPYLQDIVSFILDKCKYVSPTILTNGIMLPKLPISLIDTLHKVKDKYPDFSNFLLSEYPAQIDYKKLYRYVSSIGLSMKPLNNIFRDSDNVIRQFFHQEIVKEPTGMDIHTCWDGSGMTCIGLATFESKVFLCPVIFGFWQQQLADGSYPWYTFKEGVDYFNLYDIKSVQDIYDLLKDYKSCNYCKVFGKVPWKSALK